MGLEEVPGRNKLEHKEWAERLVGTNPCDWLAHRTLHVGLATAIYDLAARYNNVPVYKLFGQKVHSRVPVAAWTVSQTPSKMAEVARHVSGKGYTWIKYHASHFHNVVEQTRAMQQVAPPGFKVHYDLNNDSTLEGVLHLVRELREFPIAGAIEDPLRMHDLDGYRMLRQRSPLPVYFSSPHVPLLGREALMGLADGYQLSHAPVGEAIQRAGLFEAANAPFMSQNIGGNITRAFVAHMAAAMPAATLHHVTDCHLWDKDVVGPALPLAGGTVGVPDGPGLGLSLDRDALAR